MIHKITAKFKILKLRVVKEGSMGHSSEVPHTALPGKIFAWSKEGKSCFFGAVYGALRPISPSWGGGYGAFVPNFRTRKEGGGKLF